MVESNLHLDTLFTALSDATRRSILARVSETNMSIGEIAEHYKLTFAAISKHIMVLEKARLVTKRRRGREQVVIIVPATVHIAQEHIEQYTKMWDDRFNKLETVLKED